MHPFARILLIFVIYQLLLIPYYHLFPPQGLPEDLSKIGSYELFLLPIGAAVGAVILLLLLKIFGVKVIHVLEVFMALYFLPLFFQPLTQALGVEGLEWGLALLALILALTYHPMKKAVALAIAAITSVVIAQALPYPDALILGGLIALYDYIAVYKVPIMKELAKVVVTTNSILTVRAGRRERVEARELQEEGEERRVVEHIEAVDLGLGDFFVGGFLLLSAYDFSPILGLLVMAFQTVGMAYMLFQLPKKRVMPAVPIIFTANVFAYALWLLLGKPGYYIYELLKEFS